MACMESQAVIPALGIPIRLLGFAALPQPSQSSLPALRSVPSPFSPQDASHRPPRSCRLHRAFGGEGKLLLL